MQEAFEELMKICRGVWRYRWTAFAVAACAYLLGWVFVGIQRNVYEASARVYVDTSSQLRLLLDDQIVESNVEDQLRFVREAMLGRPQLERVARETGLVGPGAHPEQVQQLVSRLGRTIIITSNEELRPSRPWNSPRTDDTYTITYQHSDPKLAESVVSRLLEIFVADTIGAKRVSTEAAGQFIANQIREYEGRLRAAEESLAAFNRRNFDRLPNLQGGYFQRLQTSIEDLERSRQQLRLAQSRMDNIELQLRGEAPRISGQSPPDPTSLEARILENEARLDDLRLRFTDSHPDVVAAQEIVTQLRERQARQLEELAASGGQSLASNNPVFQALQISRNEISTEIATLRAEVAQRERQVAHLQDLINEMPEVEAELARLNRDYEVIHSHYQSLLNSLERERLTREVGESEQVEFRVIDPPRTGPEPVAPRRALLMLGVLVASIGLGCAGAFVLFQLNPVFQDEITMERTLDLPVIGGVTQYLTESGRKARAADLLKFASAALALVVLSVGALVFEVAGPGIRLFL